jgi:endoglucanase
MLAGHVDQIGLMVRYIDDDGFVAFDTVGGVDAGILSSQRVVIHGPKGPVHGIIGRKAIHLIDPEERKNVPKLKTLWIDAGAASKRDAGKRVSVGDPVTFDAPLRKLSDDLATSSGFDDKVGAFVVCETLRLLKGKRLKVGVYGVSTVQEELGLRGARTSAFGVDPQAGIAVDVDHAADYPGMAKNESGDIKLGGGPVLGRGANINPVLGGMLFAAARKRRIPHQASAEPRAMGTDANAIQISRGGVAAGYVGIPNRYMHTTVEVVSLKDLENASKVIAGLLTDMPAKVDFRPLVAHRRRGK